jgi:hypothetical protein
MLAVGTLGGSLSQESPLLEWPDQPPSILSTHQSKEKTQQTSDPLARIQAIGLGRPTGRTHGMADRLIHFAQEFVSCNPRIKLRILQVDRQPRHLHARSRFC